MENITDNAAVGPSTDATNPTDTKGSPEDWEARFKGLQKTVEEKALEVKRLKTEREALAQQLEKVVAPKVEVPEEIEELKYSDPETWRKEINRLESEALEKSKTERREILDTVTSEAAAQFELDSRKALLETFQSENPDLKIDDDVLAHDVPPRISRKLDNGEVTFEQFLNEVKKFLTTNKVVVKPEHEELPNLNNVGGGVTPSKEATVGGIKSSYKGEFY
jgi:SMC interacting uncharacterized protein involved in chromosome segregation